MSKSNAPALEAPLLSSQPALERKNYRLEDKREMEISTEKRNWDELIPDVLGLIFKDLSLEEKLTVVPGVCKSWGRAVCGPICWQEIDLEEWISSRSYNPEEVDRLIRMLVTRSCGSLSKLVANFLSKDATFSFIADNASSLQTLSIRGNYISDNVVDQFANRLTKVTSLDLTSSCHIGPKGLEALGNSCRNLTTLHYSKYAPLVFKHDDEAFAIASTMPNLKRLEVPSLLLTNDGLLDILSKCKKLEYLNIRGCRKVTLEQELLKEKYPNLMVLFGGDEDSSDEEYDYMFDLFDTSDNYDSTDNDFGYGSEYIMDDLYEFNF